MVAERKRRRPMRYAVAERPPGDWVEEYPFASMTVMFGIGLGVGFVVGHTIAEAAGRKLFQGNTLAESVTCQIRDVLKNSLPESLSQYVS